MKSLLLFAASAVLMSCGHNTKQANISESERLDQFFENDFNENVSRYPEWQTYLGKKTNYDKLNDNSEARELEEHERSKKTLQKLNTFDFAKLDEKRQTSYLLFKRRTEMGLKWFKYRHHRYPVNQMFGAQSNFPSFMINMHKIDNKEDAEAYISRLKLFPEKLKNTIISMKKSESMGIIPPKFVYAKAIRDSKNVITGKPFTTGKKDSTFLTDFKTKISKIKNLKKDDQEELIQELNSALINSIKPSYEGLISYLKILEPKAPKDVGAWTFPDGKNFYNFSLSQMTTTDMTADQIHKIGLNEVARIHREMTTIKNKVGFKGKLAAFFKHMQTSKEFNYPNTPAGKKSYLKETNRIIANIKKKLPEIFGILPNKDLIVKEVESFREKSAGRAFYQGPSFEGDRPGIYYINTSDMSGVPKYEMEALAYHEALPGHHMQNSISQELKDLPKFRRLGGYTAYGEGWGLYSEFVPKEFGLYKDPYSDFGRLSMEIWRACRLVVDTGLHAKKWSKQQAIQYLRDNTPASESEATRSIERYIVMPGQATAYKIGMLKILELRKMAKTELGEKFDIRTFHDEILRHGPLPLDVLEGKVKSWISSNKDRGLATEG